MALTKVLTVVSEAFLAQRDRWVLWLPLPLALGVIFYFSLPAEPPLYAGPLTLVFLGVCAVPFYRNPVFLWLWWGLFLVALGFSAGQLRSWDVAAPVLAKKSYPVTVEGRVIAVDTLPGTHRVTLDGLTLRTGKIWQPLPERIRIRLKANDPLTPVAGDVIAVKSILLPLEAPVLPGAFDFQRHAFFLKLGATGYAIGNATRVTAHETGFLFEALRRYIRAHIEEDITRKDDAALIVAFMVGEDTGIPEHIWEICRLSGIAHLIAISGSHFMLIAGVMFFIIRALLAAWPHAALHWPIKKIAAGAAMGAAIFYMLLIGAPIPAQRAVFSTCVIMGAIMLDRDPFTLRLVAFSALFILLIEPESLIGASFQMSFAAVVGLVSFYESTRGWWSRQLLEAPWPKRYALYLIGCFLTTLVASASTAPYSLFHFSRLSVLGGLVANMIAVPVSSFVTFPAGLLACLLMPLGLEKLPLKVTEFSLDLIMDVASTVARWPHSVYQADAWPPVLLGLITLGGLWLCIWQGRVRYLGILPILAGAVLIPFTPRPDILISADGALVAVRAPDNGALWISSKTSQKFISTEWAKREGAAGVDYWPGDVFDKDFLSCDPLGCTYRARGQSALFAYMPQLVEESCLDNLVLSTEALQAEGCRDKAQVLDGPRLLSGGAMAIYLSPDGTRRIETVAEDRGRRPWTGKPPRSEEQARTKTPSADQTDAADDRDTSVLDAGYSDDEQ